MKVESKEEDVQLKSSWVHTRVRVEVNDNVNEG